MLLLSRLLKIPLLISNSACVHIAFTPPTHSPTHDEMAKYREIQADLAVPPSLVFYGPLTMRLITYCFTAIESLSILRSVVYASAAVGTSEAIHITPGFLCATLVSIASALTRLACYREMGRLFTFPLSLKNDHQLVTSGPYSVVRHPGYTACIAHFGVALYTQLGPGSWFYEGTYWDLAVAKAFVVFWVCFMLMVTALFLCRTVDEDKMLRKEFSDEWERWARRTPYRLVPYVY